MCPVVDLGRYRKVGLPMARDRNRQQHPKHQQNGHINWFASADSDVTAIADWDLKTQTFAEAVLAVLAAGNAIMFGVSMAGDAISVTIYAGDAKQRKWVSDSIELDDLMAAIWSRGRAYPGSKIRDISQEAAD